MSDAIADEAHLFLRGNFTGAIRFDEHFRPLKYVIGPDGRIVAPVMVAMLQSVDTVLFVPDYEDGALELQVTLEQFEERGESAALADRWRIYHGEPEDVRWAFLRADSARFRSMVIDGDALCRPNLLAQHESRLCRFMNQQHSEDLRRMCAAYADFVIEKPVMVGIDAGGLDVRARFDVVRIRAVEPMNTADDAERVLHLMMKKAAEIGGH